MNVGKNKGPLAEINVTPFVDVMLVLLIIFMVTAPLMFNGIKLQLPKTQRVNQLQLDKDQAILSINPLGELYLGEDPITQEELISKIQQLFKEIKTDVLFIRADYELKYEVVAKIMSRLKQGGIGNLALVTEIERRDEK